MQNHFESKNSINAFRRIAKGGQPLQLMLGLVETHARKLGFKEIKIRRPETLFYYQSPLTHNRHTKATDEILVKTGKTVSEEKFIRRQMKILYARITSQMGFVRGEFFYTKKL
ncbi:MAG: hypothetical protein WCI04_04175 [archaeon]